MLDTVIVGIDGRDGGRDALALARLLAPDATPILAHAYPVHPEWGAFADPGFFDQLRQHAEEMVAGVAREAGVEAEISLTAEMSPARALQALAEERDADLLVVGSPHRGAVGRVLLGDVGRDLLQGAPCPVAVAPRGVHRDAVRRIGVAYDASPESERALELGAELAASFGARLTLITVARPLSTALAAYAYAYDAAELDRIERDRCQRLVEEARQGLDSSLDVDVEVRDGLAADELARASDELDLLVVGSRGWGPVRRVVAGSTSARLAHQAECPLIVAPRSAHAGEAAGEADAAAAADG